MLKKDFESQNFAIFEEVVRNFDRSDEDIIYSEKMLISNWCLHGLMPNLIKKSVTVPIAEVTCPPQNMFTLDIQINKHCTLTNSGNFFYPVLAY